MTSALLTIAQLGHAHWFFGNLYEAVVKVPDRLAEDPNLEIRSDRITPRSLLRRGSPVLYFLPGAPVAIGAPLATLAAGWTSQAHDRKWLAVSAGCSLAGGLLTGYIVRQLNTRLFFTVDQPDRAERDVLLRQWHLLNYARLAASGTAWLAAQRARRQR
jgi:hypothetical protein